MTLQILSGTERPAASTDGAKCDAAVEISQGKNAVDAAKEVCLSVVFGFQKRELILTSCDCAGTM